MAFPCDSPKAPNNFMAKTWIPTRHVGTEDMEADHLLVEACRKLVRVARNRLELCETEDDVRAIRWRITAVTREVQNLAGDLEAGIRKLPPV